MRKLLSVLLVAACGADESAATSEIGFRAVDPCPSASSYVYRGSVQMRATFDPPCVRLAAGGTVVFQTHPIAPRAGGDSWSPITLGAYEVEFPDPGLFPYGCSLHPGEIGAVLVDW